MSKINEITQPNPETQRHAVLAIHSIAANNAALFRQEMIDNEFPSKRLLTTQYNSLSAVPGLNNYQTESLIFNTRYQYHPFIIVMCKSTEDVQLAYTTAIKYNLPVRVRAGGHDHAGECSGDNVVLIDVTGIQNFDLAADGVATIGAGYRFYQLTPKLAEENRMIAHGTCATVGLAGFIQGGGWGPWTRKHGMCCESLVGATVILGDGSCVELSDEDTDKCKKELLWALRGGGGMSYGIVTELKLQTFELPQEIHRFDIQWNEPEQKRADKNYCVPQEDETTVDILKQWEKSISSYSTPKLLGTNLKINALPLNEKNQDKDILAHHHHCIMYGYWEGNETDLKAFIHDQFNNVSPAQVTIGKASGAGLPNKYDHQLMGNWARNSLSDISHRLGKIGTLAIEGTAFAPDYDAPAPHKITSRFVDDTGLTEDGYKELLQSLTSPLLSLENEQQGLFSYVTLGAIQGEFYQSHDSLPDIAFPYRDCQYTIQYQTWWNEAFQRKIELQNSLVYVDVNRAMDWIDSSRDTKIDGTHGAFISFKDPAIPTKTYFGKSYQRLVSIKKEYVEDPFNHLRTRKTII